MDEREIIAQRIKEYRTKENLNQYEFAEECGISRNLLSLIERKNDNITLDTLMLLSSRMGTTLQQLLGYNEISYFVLPSKVVVEGVTYNTYGIGAIKGYIVVGYILDLSTDFDKVKQFVKLCNDEGLSLIHLKDVAEDFVNI